MNVRARVSNPTGYRGFGRLMTVAAVILLTRGGLVGLGAPPVPTPVSFAPAVHYAVDGFPHAVAVGDFNRDNSPDLVAAKFNHSLAVLLGNGDGTFGTAIESSSSEAFSVAVGDFDADGKSDLVGVGPTVVSVHLGHGDGTFAVTEYGLDHAASSVAIGDFNGDTKPDLVISNLGADNVSVLLGHGDGTFAAASHFPAGFGSKFAAVGDFNEDHLLDVATADVNGFTVSVLLGNGDGTLNAAISYEMQPQPASVAVSDFDGDGHLDLATAESVSNQVSVLFGNGDGTFATPAPAYAVEGNPLSVVVGDFNADDMQDLATANAAGSVSLLLGIGDGTFATPAPAYPVGSFSKSVAAADFDGDGRLDLVAANHSSRNLSVLLHARPADTTAPTAAILTPPDGASYVKGAAVNADYTCEDETQLGSCLGSVTDGAAIDTATVGSHDFTVTAEDAAGHETTVTHTYSVIYAFTGFFPPTVSSPSVNVVTAGKTAPVMFSLDGNQGLNIFAPGAPSVTVGSCSGGAHTEVATESLGLHYDASTDLYSYLWKTAKSWAGQCGTLHLQLADGRDYTALFRFKK